MSVDPTLPPPSSRMPAGQELGTTNKTNCKINVITGLNLNAGTTSNVWISLTAKSGNIHTLRFGKFLLPGETKKKSLTINCPISEVVEIEVLLEKGLFDDEWYLEKVVITDNANRSNTIQFPVDRWIKTNVRCIINAFDTSLPQDDKPAKKVFRLQELEDKRSSYKIKQNFPGGPAQITKQPSEENFGIIYQSKIDIDAIIAEGQKLWGEICHQARWTSFSDLEGFYSDKFKDLDTLETWRDDEHFARQRICGVNPTLITLCTEIPEKLNVTEETLVTNMEMKTLQQAIDENRLFFVDLAILEGTPVKENNFVLPCPIALFYQNTKDILMPIAIQLFQTPSENNPVFYPTDEGNTWLMAKLWYNIADASYHQSLTHLAFTHLIMEGVAIATHRQLSQSHPIFKLLAPHFLDIIAINSLALQKLISKGGWVDNAMSIGANGMIHLVAKGLKSWRLDTQGNLPADLAKRGLLDTGVLKGYHFRDDALLIYGAIENYVSDYVNLYYGGEEKSTKLAKDEEIRKWGCDLASPIKNEGCGMKGLPNHGKFKTLKDLIITLTSIIYTCSAGHAAANFGQYKEYGFPPNYPSYLNGTPPTTKDPIADEQVLKALPNEHVSLEIMSMVKILSKKGTKSLGDFEKQYIYDPAALEIVKRFRAKLAKISQDIKDKNQNDRKVPYVWLDPEKVPNSISI